MKPGALNDIWGGVNLGGACRGLDVGGRACLGLAVGGVCRGLALGITEK